MSVQYFEGIGRRKACTARVRIMSGEGRFVVNEKDGQVYFPRLGDLEAIMAPLAAAGEDRTKYDITVLVKGGGASGQAVAVQLGLARALLKINPEWNASLRKGGFLTRDARVKERKKPGLKGARKAPTYTKR